MRRTLESIQWGLFCTSSWTWCIGMYLPFILLRLWGWPGFWAFFVPNVLGCAAFGFVLDRQRSRALAARLGWTCALFSAVTVAYQCFFAGWAAQWFVGDGPDAMRTVAATGVPIALLVLGVALAVRGDAFWRTAGTVVTLVSGLVVLLPGGVDPARAAGDAAAVGGNGWQPLLGPISLVFALPTIVAGFLLSPYFDLTFHRAAQQAPSPRIAFATFGLTFAAMLLLVASFFDFDPAAGGPRVGPALATLWGVQLVFTVAVHLRELFAAHGGIRIPAHVVGGLAALAVLLATPASLFGWATGPDGAWTLAVGEPTYLGFLGAYGLLFPVLFLMESRGGSRAATLAVLAVGVPCYLLGAVNFMTWLMPVPVVLAWATGRRRK